MNELGCYTDGQRQEIDTADTWDCPACAGLNNAQTIDRECQSREELTKVTWMPSWDPEELSLKLICFMPSRGSFSHFLIPSITLCLVFWMGY
eukprot:1146008-Pelagomonas_calceolata.AAC.2